MKRPLYYILQIITLVMVFSVLIFDEVSFADSIIRVIGDKSAKPSVPADGSPQSTPVNSRGNTTIRIVGDKPVTNNSGNGLSVKPSGVNSNVIRIVGDKNAPAEKITPDAPDLPKIAPATTQPTVVNVVDVEEQERLEVEKRLADIKAEEARKIAEKIEQERLAKLKAEQEKAAAEAIRLAAEKLAEEKLAIIKAEEERRALEKAEQERIAKEKREQERIAREKAELERIALEKAEQERISREKAEQEKKAAEAMRLAIEKQVQERMAALRAAEAKEASERAERFRAAALKAEEDRLAVARRAVAEKLISPAGPQPRQMETDAMLLNEPSSSNMDQKQANSGPAETIWDLYLSAKSNDPALGRSQARVNVNQADSDVVKSGLLPHLDSSAGFRQISQTLSNYSPSDINKDYNSLNYNITARMTLLNVPTIYSMAAAAASLRAEQAGLAAARQNLIVRVTDSYFSLLKAQTDRQIALGEIKRLKQVLDQSQAFLKAGTGDIIAVYEAQSRLDGAGADLTKSESNLRLAEQKLSSVVGRPVTSIVNYMQRTPNGPDPDDLDWWVAVMEKEQPAVRQAREGVAQTAELRKAVKAEYLPVVQASGGYDVNRGTAALPTAEVRQWFVGASLSLPLYSGGETSAKVRRAVATEEERRHIFDETMDQQRENVKQAFFNLRYNISLIKALEQRKSSAEIQLAAVKKGRNIGTRSAIDLLNAEQSYSIALRDLQNALYDNFIRVIQLKSAAGVLSEADVAEVSKSVYL